MHGAVMSTPALVTAVTACMAVTVITGLRHEVKARWRNPKRLDRHFRSNLTITNRTFPQELKQMNGDKLKLTAPRGTSNNNDQDEQLFFGTYFQVQVLCLHIENGKHLWKGSRQRKGDRQRKIVMR